MDPTRSDSRGNVLDTVFLIPTRACSAQIRGDMNGKQVKPLRYNTVFTRNHYYHRSKKPRYFIQLYRDGLPITVPLLLYITVDLELCILVYPIIFK